MLCKSVVGSILYINRWIYKDDYIWRHHIINNISQGSIQICLCIIHVFNNYLPMVRLKLKLIYNVALKLCHSACDVLISLPNEMTTFKGTGQTGKGLSPNSQHICVLRKVGVSAYWWTRAI